MNTRQKLTLGIAAIFMVTLTIIGVTYAYFVTRVNYTGTETTAIIQTADIGSSINITAPIVLENAIPGDTTYKAFAVSTASASGVPFSIMITTSLNPDISKMPADKTESTWQPTLNDKLPEFVHTNLSDSDTFNAVTGYESVGKLTGSCYMSIDAAKAYTGKTDETEARSGCYDAAARYNNIELTLYRVYSNSGHAVYPVMDEGDIASYSKFYERSELGITDGTAALAKFPTETFKADNLVDGIYELTLTNDKKVYADLVPVDPNTPTGAKEQNILAPYNNSYVASGNAIIMGGSQIVPTKFETPTNNSYNLYVLKVHYKDVEKNQNIENDASLNIKIDITGNAEVTN